MLPSHGNPAKRPSPNENENDKYPHFSQTIIKDKLDMEGYYGY
jgi:hypothetical protein